MFKRNALITLVIIVIFGLLSGCSAARNPTTALQGSSKSDGYTAAPAAPGELQPGSGNQGAGNPSGSSNTDAAGIERLVIKNADIEIAVADPIKTLDVISKMAEDMQGYVVSSSTYQYVSDNGATFPQAVITIRVPAERLDEALQTIVAQVKNSEQDVITKKVTGQDVTKEYTDLQSRQKNLEQAEQQLREIMASATKPEDVLNIFNQLTQIREQIEVLKGQIQYYQESAALSAINVTIRAEASIQPISIGTWQPAGVARDAIQALLNGVKFLANAAIWLVLFVLPIGILIYLPLRLIWFLIRRWRARRKGLHPTPPTAPAAPGGN